MKLVKYVILAGLILATASRGFSAGKEIYPDPSRASEDLKVALAQASAQHKHVIVDFGGNWCPDCQVLDIYFHDAQNLAVLDADFILVHVNIGRVDANLDIAQRYGIPLNKGVPALAVLGSGGEVLYSQKNGEFESMRRMQSSDVTKFLQQWK